MIYPGMQAVSSEMLSLLAQLRQQCAIGTVGGSDLPKQQEQLGAPDVPVTTLFDFNFAENGLTAFKNGLPLASHSFIKWIGEEQYKELVRFVLHYVADLDIPIKRGTFVEFRNGMINVSPIGRNASNAERLEFERYDKEHGIRAKFVEELRSRFGHLGLTYVYRPFSTHSLDVPSCLTILVRRDVFSILKPFPPGSPSAARSPSTSSPRAGTRRTACSTSRTRPSGPAASSTPRSTSSATRPWRAATTGRSTTTSGPWATPSPGPRTR